MSESASHAQQDEIIMPILEQAGCGLPSTVNSISKIAANVDLLYQVVTRLLLTIKSTLFFPKAFPPAQNKAVRVRVATSITSAIDDLGFRGEHGFQMFMYPQEKDVRELLSWLVNRVPAAKNILTTESIGAPSMTNIIVDKIAEWSKQTWTPTSRSVSFSSSSNNIPVCAISIKTPYENDYKLSTATQQYMSKYQPLLAKQVPSQHIPPSVFEINTRQVVLLQEQEKEWEANRGETPEQTMLRKRAEINKIINDAFHSRLQHIQSSLSQSGQNMNDLFSAMSAYSKDERKGAFARKTDFMFDKTTVATETKNETKEETEEEMKKKYDLQISALQEKIKLLLENGNKYDTQNAQSLSQQHSLEGLIAEQQRENESLIDQMKIKKQTIQLLPHAEKNMEELTKIIATSKSHLLELGEEWEKVRVPLVAQFRRKKQLLNERKEEVGKKIEEIRRMREEMKTMASQIREKDETYKQVEDEFSKLPKSINRQLYVQRIMDIVRAVDKQKSEINRILEDVKQLQRDINTLTESTGRSFSIADETIYSAASDKKDTTAAQVYKSVVEMRQYFENLIDIVSKTGRTKNELMEIEQRYDLLEQHSQNMNVSQVQTDLEQVKGENKTASSKLKSLKAELQKKQDSSSSTSSTSTAEDETA
eukprot:TRINITY_DN5007_c0_g1_i1.p1 TRINITY_DN5007_c0_g1~~TRINITY_DN5007_c0_g1_i1.p1  ORF type:complete len:678 (-),score=202.46 TRINITY_DN5007_c0_g1_i1:131-2080(-)